MARPIHRQYRDPLAQVWLGAAARMGLTVVRSGDAYASTDGRGTLVIGSDDSLDADDSLAQMIFHEICHWLVQGEDASSRPDWGLDNVGDGDTWREHATLRTQAVLAGRYGLRDFFAPTTDFRAFWDQLPADPIADRADPSVSAALLAVRRAGTPPWSPHLAAALDASAAIAAVAAGFVPAARLVRKPDELTSLWAAVAPRPPPHPTGLPARPKAADAAGHTCGTCAWRHGATRSRCRQADGARVEPSWPACERWEPALDCQTCGACCRAAYHSVEVSRRDPMVRARPDYIVDRGSYLEVRRNGDRCAALHGGDVIPTTGGALTTTRHTCVIYDDRPRTCREFTLGSANCLVARRRVGLSL